MPLLVGTSCMQRHALVTKCIRKTWGKPDNNIPMGTQWWRSQKWMVICLQYGLAHGAQLGILLAQWDLSTQCLGVLWLILSGLFSLSRSIIWDSEMQGSHVCSKQDLSQRQTNFASEIGPVSVKVAKKKPKRGRCCTKHGGKEYGAFVMFTCCLRTARSPIILPITHCNSNLR